MGPPKAQVTCRASPKLTPQLQFPSPLHLLHLLHMLPPLRPAFWGPASEYLQPQLRALHSCPQLCGPTGAHPSCMDPRHAHAGPDCAGLCSLLVRVTVLTQSFLT